MIKKPTLQACGRPIVVASHMRSGTHLMIDLLRRQFAACRSWKWPGEPNDMLYLPLDVFALRAGEWDKFRALRVLHRTKRPLLKTHWTSPSLENLRHLQPDLADWIESEGTFLHVVRNPFAVLASQWAWDCSLQGIPATRSRPESAWIRDQISSWVHHYRIWSQRENTHLFRYEDVLADPAGTLRRLSGLLGENALFRQPLLPGKLRGLWHSRWNRLTGIRPESTEIITEGGAPEVGEVFTGQDINLVRELAGDCLNGLGYWPPEGEGRTPLDAEAIRTARTQGMRF